MRVLVVTLSYPPPTVGGYDVMTASVCERLAGRGHDVTVLCEGDAVEQVVRGVRVLKRLRSYWDGAACVFPPFDEAAAMERHNAATFRDVVGRAAPDVISFWQMGVISLGLITRASALYIPLSFVVGDDWLVNGDWADGWLRRFRTDHDPDSAEQVARDTGLPTVVPDVASLGVVCFVSDHTRRRAEVHGVHPARWCLAPPGVDRDLLAVGEERAWDGSLLWVGRVTRDKGILTAVRALDLLDGMNLRVVGDVDPAVRADLDALIDELGARDRISFDVLPHEQIARAYDAADVTLFTSEVESEAFGLVPLESMACGTPVVATGIGGSGEYCLHEENCLLFPPGDHRALAQAVARLRDDEMLRLGLSIGGVKTASVLTADTQSWIIERALYAALDGAPA